MGSWEKPHILVSMFFRLMKLMRHIDPVIYRNNSIKIKLLMGETLQFIYHKDPLLRQLQYILAYTFTDSTTVHSVQFTVKLQYILVYTCTDSLNVQDNIYCGNLIQI